MRLTQLGTGWNDCEARTYRFDMSTDLHIVDATIVETYESRLKRTLTAYCFTREQQKKMKREAETAWAADGYIVLSGPRADFTDEKQSTKDTVSTVKVRAKTRKCRKLKLTCAVM